jgi:hypothetical protein
MKRCKIQHLLDCLEAHAATGKEGVCFYFFIKIENFYEKIKTNSSLAVAAWHIKTRDFTPFHV